MVNRGSAAAEAAIVELIRGVPNNHVELHVEYLRRVDAVNERVRVGFECLITIEFRLTCPANLTTTVAVPRVTGLGQANVSIGPVKRLGAGDAELAIGLLRAIQRAAADERGQFRDRQTEDLFGENVIDAGLLIGHLILQADIEPTGDLAQKHAALAHRIQKSRIRPAEQVLRQYVEHGRREFGRREHLIGAEIRQTGEDVGVVAEGVVHFLAFSLLDRVPDSEPAATRRPAGQ